MKLSVFTLRRTSSKPGEFPSDFVRGAEVIDAIETDLSRLRAKILDVLLPVAGVVSLIVYLISLPALVDLARNAKWGWLVMYGLMCVSLLVLAFVRRIPYLVRASLFLLVLFVFGLTSLMTSGISGSGLVFLIAVPIFAGVFLGPTGRVNALVLSVVIIVIVGILMDSQAVVLANPFAAPGSASEASAGLLQRSGHPWLLAAGIFTLLAVAVTLSMDRLVREMENGLRKRQSTLQELEGHRLHLENQMEQNSQDLERRLVQIRTAAEITGTINRGGVTVPLRTLLPQVCELILDRFDLYYVGIFLIERGERWTATGGGISAGERGLLASRLAREYAVLASGTGEAGEAMLAEGHKLEVGGESMIGWCTANRQARIALDVGKEAVRFSNPHLPETRSEIALPILSREEVLGAITIQSNEESAFDKDDVTVLQSIADNLASAIENARLFTETQASLDEIQTLHRQYLESAWVETLQTQGGLQYTFSSPAKRLRAGESSSGDFAEPGESTTIAGQATILSGTGPLRRKLFPIRLRDQIIGILTLEAEPHSETGVSQEEGREATEWTPEEMALIEAVTDQTALALENARLLEETRRRAEQERLTAGIAGKVWASPSVDRILRTALQELSASLGVTEGSIQL